MLKEKKDAEALKLAKETSALDEKDTYAQATLAMAYHYNNNPASRDVVLQKMAKDSSAASMLTYVKDVISGKEFFRN
jgi:hypothetical protein